MVEINASPPEKPPAPDLTVRNFFALANANKELRRIYNADQYIIEDKWLEKRFPWNGNQIDERLAEAVDASLHKALQSLLED